MPISPDEIPSDEKSIPWGEVPSEEEPERYRVEIRVWNVNDESVKTLISANFEGPARAISESARAALDEFVNHVENKRIQGRPENNGSTDLREK